MAVLSVQETTERDVSVSATEAEYTRTFRVRVDSTADQGQTIYLATVGRIPRYLESHPENFFCKCKGLKFKPTTEHWQWWTVTATYNNQPITVEEREREKPNPLDRAAKIRWSRNRYTEPIYKDRFGRAILNSAGDYYDPPPERLASYWVATVTKNLASIPDWALGPNQLDNVVNESQFTLQGRTVLPRCALFVPDSISEQLEENGVRYHEISYQLEFRKPPDVLPAQILDPENAEKSTKEARGHDLILMDQGLRVAIRQGNVLEIGNVINATDDQGNDVTAPIPLNGQGEKLDEPKPDKVFYFAYEVYKPADFRILPMT